MRIEQNSTIAGVRSLIVRDILRDARRYLSSRWVLRWWPGLSSQNVEGLFKELINLGYITSPNLSEEEDLEDGIEAGESGNTLSYKVTELGHRFAGAAGTHPLKRSTADKLVSQLLERARSLPRVNSEYVNAVDRIILFGSYVSDSPTLGDIDVGIELVGKYDEGGVQYAAWKKREKLKAYSKGYHDIFWSAEDETKKFLKAKKSYYSFHSIDRDVLTSKPHLPRQEIYNRNKGGDLTITVPARYKNADKIRGYRLGYGDRMDGLPPQKPINQPVSAEFMAGYAQGYEDFVPVSVVVKPPINRKPVLFRALILGEPEVVATLEGFRQISATAKFPLGTLVLVDLELPTTVNGVAEKIESESIEVVASEVVKGDFNYEVHFGPERHRVYSLNDYGALPVYTKIPPMLEQIYNEIDPPSNYVDWKTVFPFSTKKAAIDVLKALARKWKLRDGDPEHWSYRHESAEDLKQPILAQTFFRQSYWYSRSEDLESKPEEIGDFSMAAIARDLPISSQI